MDYLCDYEYDFLSIKVPNWFEFQVCSCFSFSLPDLPLQLQIGYMFTTNGWPLTYPPPPPSGDKVNKG